MNFLILKPLSPKTGYHFLEGGGQKFSLRRLQQWGDSSLWHPRRSNGNAADATFSVGGSTPGRLTGCGGGGATPTRPGLEPPTKGTPISCFTIRPLLELRQNVSPLLGAVSVTDKKPKLCVSV